MISKEEIQQISTEISQNNGDKQLLYGIINDKIYTLLKNMTNDRDLIKLTNDILNIVRDDDNYVFKVNKLIELAFEAKNNREKKSFSFEFLKISIPRAPLNELAVALHALSIVAKTFNDEWKTLIIKSFFKCGSIINNNTFSTISNNLCDMILSRLFPADSRSVKLDQETLESFVKMIEGTYGKQEVEIYFVALYFCRYADVNLIKKDLLNVFDKEKLNNAVNVLKQKGYDLSGMSRTKYLKLMIHLDVVISDLTNLVDTFLVFDDVVSQVERSEVFALLVDLLAKQFHMSQFFGRVSSIKDFVINNSNKVRTCLPPHIKLFKEYVKAYKDMLSDDIEFLESIFVDTYEAQCDNELHFLYFYLSNVNPKPVLTNTVTKYLFKGDHNLTNKSLIYFYYMVPFDEPLPRVYACIFIDYTDFSEACSNLLKPYTISIGEFRRPSYSRHQIYPTTTKLFECITQDDNVKKMILNGSSQTISELFTFASKCVKTLPIPFMFIAELLEKDRHGHVSNFLSCFCEDVPNSGSFRLDDIDYFISQLFSQSDTNVVDSISAFIRWTNAEISWEDIAEALSGDNRTAFLSHFGCPFEESMQLLQSNGKGDFAKRMLKNISKRGILTKEHFDILYPILNSDIDGLEILSNISMNNKDLSETLLNSMFSAPLVTTEKIELVTSCAKSLSKILDEDLFMSKVAEVFKDDKCMRNASIFLLYVVNNRIPKNIWFVTRSFLYCSGAANVVVRSIGLYGLNFLREKCTDEQLETFDAAINGKNIRNENSLETQARTGQAQSLTITTLFQLANKDVQLFVNLLLPLIDDQIFSFVEFSIPTPVISKEQKSELSAYFFYERFSPEKERAADFRKLYEWSTDGGLKLSVGRVIDIVKSKTNEGLLAQETNCYCIKSLLDDMSYEEKWRYFAPLAEAILAICFSPAQLISQLGIACFIFFVKSIGDINKAYIEEIFAIFDRIIESNNKVLIETIGETSKRMINVIVKEEDMLRLFEILVRCLLVYGDDPSPETLAGRVDVVTNLMISISSKYHLSFFECVRGMISSSLSTTAKYAVFKGYDICLDSKRHNTVPIMDKVVKEIPRLFEILSSENNRSIYTVIISCVINSAFIDPSDPYSIKNQLCMLYFDKDRPELVAQMLLPRKNINFSNELGPLLYFISFEDKAKIGETLFEEISQYASEQITKYLIQNNYQDFIDFYSNILFEKSPLKAKQVAAVALNETISSLSKEILSQQEGLARKILDDMDTTMYKNKEFLLSALSYIVPELRSDQLTDVIPLVLKQCNRQKSVYRANAAVLIKTLSESNRTLTDEQIEAFHNSLVHMASNGTRIAIETAADVASMFNMEKVQIIADAIYKRSEIPDKDILWGVVNANMRLPPHKLPDGFDISDVKEVIATLE